MRLITATTLAMLGLASLTSGAHHHSRLEQYETNKSIPVRKEVKKGRFGATEVAEFPESDDLKMVKVVYPPSKDFVRDYERQARALK